MRFSRTTFATLFIAMLVIPSIAAAGEIELYSVLYPERTKTEIKMLGKDVAPSTVDAYVTAKKGQTDINLVYKAMKPAILFGGEITSYVVWAVTGDGTAENLGELWIKNPDGEAQFKTGARNFALLITAEQFPGKRKPGEMVIFYALPPKNKDVKATAMKFTNFGVTGKAEYETLASLKYDEKMPVDVTQARKIYDMAEAFGARSYDAAKMDQAKLTLTQAENLAKGGDMKSMADYSRRTVALTSDAIRLTATKKAEEAAAALEAQRKGELDAAAANAERASLEAARVTAQLQEVERQRSLLAAETALLATQKASIEKERDELKARLEGALGQVASTKATARGLVVSFGDILFDVNKATVKADTQQTVAKLAGILLMMPSMNVRIEGHTDSTGKEEANMKLSENRAKAVYDLLVKHGIPADRLAFQGYGPKIPVADNSTKDGRAQNRRVEVVINEGAIQGAQAPAN